MYDFDPTDRKRLDGSERDLTGMYIPLRTVGWVNFTEQRHHFYQMAAAKLCAMKNNLALGPAQKTNLWAKWHMTTTSTANAEQLSSTLETLLPSAISQWRVEKLEHEKFAIWSRAFQDLCENFVPVCLSTRSWHFSAAVDSLVGFVR